MSEQEGTAKRKLLDRHIQFIAIGGTIGTGLFLGAGQSISLTGPTILLVYLIVGAFMFFMMRAIGEMLYADPNQHTFINFISRYLGNRAGFFARWSYWLALLFMGMAELTAIGRYVQYWLPNVHLWVIQVVALVLLTAMNLVAVGVFGETEFWFSMIKIGAIVGLIGTGIIMMLTGFETPQGSVGFQNLFNDFELFPNGLKAFTDAFQMVLFAFIGVEFIGMTSAETKDPRKVLPKAINEIPLRILLFYFGALTIIMCIYPWRDIPANKSPFVMVFSMAGLKWAATLINFVVLTSAASALNSVIFSAGRNFYALAHQSKITSFKNFVKLSKAGIPASSILVTALCLLLSPVISVIPSIQSAFSFIAGATTDLFLMIYILIMFAYLKFKKSKDFMEDGFILKYSHIVVPITICFFIFVYFSLFFNVDTYMPAIGASIWCVIFGYISWKQPKTISLKK